MGAEGQRWRICARGRVCAELGVRTACTKRKKKAYGDYQSDSDDAGLVSTIERHDPRVVYDRTAIATAPAYATSAQRAPAPSVVPEPRIRSGAG